MKKQELIPFHFISPVFCWHCSTKNLTRSLRSLKHTIVWNKWNRRFHLFPFAVPTISGRLRNSGVFVAATQLSETRASCAGFFMLNRELSVSLLRRLAIVLSPVKSSKMIYWVSPNSAALDIIHASMASVLVCTNFQVTGYRLQVTVSPWMRFALSTVKHKETRTQGAGFSG